MQEENDLCKIKWLRQILFIFGGALAGLLYYYYASCSSGTCVISSSPVLSMLYMAVIGWLLSALFEKGCDS